MAYTARNLFNDILSRISLYDLAEKHSITYFLLEHIHGIDKKDVVTGRELKNISPDEYAEAVARINNAEPVQYVIGETWFYGRAFTVTPAVLIPRPETEELVDHIVQEKQDTPGLKVLDIGTGSGCIPVSLAKELKDATVYSIDISSDALAVAKENAERHQARVQFILQDIFEEKEDFKGQVDIIVSNPPYVLESERKVMHKNVLDFEPATALFVPDDDPLIFYRSIFQLAENSLLPGGTIYLEINERFGHEMTELAISFDYKLIRVLKDLRGKERFVIIEKS